MSKSPAELDREIEEWLREKRERAAKERHEMRLRRIGGRTYRGGRPRAGGREDI